MRPLCFNLLAICLAFVLFSCDPHEEPAKALPPFDLISANGPVTFKLVSGATNQVVSTSMLDQEYNVGGGTLQINGLGSMTIAVKDIKQFYCNGCSIKNDEPLVADTLNMTVHAGTVKLSDINISGWLGLNTINTGSHKFSGRANFFYATLTNLTNISAYNLVTDSTYVNSSAIGDVEVTATQVVNVFINSLGSVKYKGHPPIVRLTKTGSGNLIKAD